MSIHNQEYDITSDNTINSFTKTFKEMARNQTNGNIQKVLNFCRQILSPEISSGMIAVTNTLKEKKIKIMEEELRLFLLPYVRASIGNNQL